MALARPVSRLLVIALAALLVTIGWPASAARGADDSNIPGIPLPDNVVTGTLGGPVYDRVYAIDVPADRVILLALSGDPGTDFDLYLFDASATTVYTTQGQVASSTSNSSTESISYATMAGGRFYIDLNGASDVLGTFRLTVRFATDRTPPNAEVRLDDGAPATPDSTIRVTLVATDDVSGVTDMQFSVDGVNWAEWRPYAPFTLWSFPQVDGPRRLWARVRDRSGNVSAVTTAEIAIDTSPPAVVSRSPGPEEQTTSLRPTFSVVFSEGIDPKTWTTLGLVLQGPEGASVRGEYVYDETRRMGTFTPSADLKAGTAYVATLGNIADLAGNQLVAIGSWVVRPVRSRTLTLAVDKSAATYGSVVTLSGNLHLPLESSAVLERSTGGGSWSLLGVVSPDAAGQFAILTKPTTNSRYRLHIEAGAADLEQTSAPVGVTVRPKVALRSVSSTTTRHVSVGATVSVRAGVSPAAAAPRITMSIYRYDTVKRSYVLAGTVMRGTLDGVAAFAWRPTRSGSYYLRFAVPASALWGSGISPTYRWVVG
jgi:Big-like domain-containing protein